VIARTVAAALLLVLVVSCTGLPPITPGSDTGTPGGIEAGRVFPQGDWQFLHAIQAEMAAGRGMRLLGLTVMSSGNRFNRSVLMTLEGLVLFDGEYDGRLVVHRALPPFDSPHFADGLMQDIRLIFFEPEGPVISRGRLRTGEPIERHRLPDGCTVDVEIQSDGGWGIRRYSASETPTRTVRAQRGAEDLFGIPATIELTAGGGQDYRLVMKLLEAVPAGR
jgi:hypothetical protein